jgi:hypothetical protein
LLDIGSRFQNQDVGILIDEMKIKEGLVYQQETGKLIGFVDATDNEVLDEKQISTTKESVATHVLVFMVRGLKSDLQTVVATYATKSATSHQLYEWFWEVTAACELVDLRVRVCISDGASSNRKMYKLHKNDYPQDSITFRAKNKFATNSRDVYFVSDSAHLMKTTRNCLENSGGYRNTRRLIVSNKLRNFFYANVHRLIFVLLECLILQCLRKEFAC